MRPSQRPFLPLQRTRLRLFVTLRFLGRAHSHGGVRELLLGEVERMVGSRDAVATGVLLGGQTSPQDGVVCNTEEGHRAVPGLVVEPHLPGQR